MSIPWQAPPPARQRPPLTKRMRLRHWLALDYLAALPCALVVFLNGQHLLLRHGTTWYGLRGIALSVVVAGAVSLPVALRRRNPMGALIASMVAAVAGPLITATADATSAATLAPAFPQPVHAGAGTALQSASVYFLPTAYVIYLVAALYRRTVAAAALGVVLFLLIAEALAIRLSVNVDAGPSVFAALLVIISWMVGYTAGQRRAYAAQLQVQAAAGAVTEERLRIARELHDVVAHSMTVIAVQAGYGHHVIDEQPGKAREALGAIQATSREALTEMRRMLGVLRQPSPAPLGRSKFQITQQAGGHNGSGGRANGGAGAPTDPSAPRPAAPLAPAPGLGDLDRLVARIGHAGVAVDLRVHGIRRELPQGVDLAAFRIVQEALTNVVKHAGTPFCTVTIGYHEDGLSIEVTDQGRGCEVPAGAGARGKPGAGVRGEPGAGVRGEPGAGVRGEPRGETGAGARGETGAEPAGGHGLIGMRERVSLYGGELTAVPLPERGFRVAARLPVGDGTP